MKRLLLLLSLVALSVGCQAGLRAQRLSTEPTTWQGSPGTAVTIQVKGGTDQFKVAKAVTFRFDGGPPHGPKGGQWKAVFDFVVPVMKVEPHALTLFFWRMDIFDEVLEELPNQVEAGTLTVIPCDLKRVCG